MKIFLLFFILTFVYNVAAQSEPPPRVLDAQGKFVVPGEQYYIASPVDTIGGIGLPNNANTTCPSKIIQSLSELGLPVQFWPVDPYSVDFYANQTDVFINFPDGVTGCGDNGTFWQADYEGGRLVKLFAWAGTLENDNPFHQFRFLQYGAGDSNNNSYVLATCPPFSWVPCTHVGIAEVNGERRLVVDNKAEPYKILLRQKVSSTGDDQDGNLVKVSK